MKTRISANSNRSGGFTLVEVLIVIGITAVLAALIFGVTGRVSQEASKIDSVNTMRSIGRAIAQYATDNRQMLPGPMPGQQHPGYLAGGRWLSNYLQPYLAPDQPTATAQQTGAPLLRGFVPRHWERWYLQRRPATPRVYEMPYTMYRDAASNQITPFGRVTPLTPPTNYQAMLEKFRLPTMVAFRTYHGAQNSELAPPFGEIQNYTVRLYFDWHVDVISTEK